MTDKTSVEGIAIWLKQVFGSSSWMAGRVAQELSDDILEVIQTQYPTYHTNIRIGLLFALLCIRKGQHQYLRDNINKTLERASKDSEEWVVVTAHALNNFPANAGLNFDLENATDKFSDALNHVNNAMKSHGISFHPTEFAYKDKKHYPQCPSASKDFAKMEPTVKQHFKLAKNSSSVVSREDRMSQLRAIAKEVVGTSPQQPTTSTNAPSAAAGLTAPSENLPAKMAAGRGQGGSSLFIQRPGNRVPVRKPSIGSKPSFLRTVNPARASPTTSQPRASIQSILSTGPNGPGGADEPITPKGFIKPSKIQMIDINESAAIQENIDKANAEVQAQNELKKQQAKQAAEERKRVAEERKLELQREREEKRERRKQETEERKRKKEQERLEAAAAREEAKQAAAQNAEGDSPPKAKRARRDSEANNEDYDEPQHTEDSNSSPYENLPSSMHPPIPSLQSILPSQPPIMSPLSSPPSSSQAHPAFFYPPRNQPTHLPAPQHMLQNPPPSLPPLSGYAPPPMPYVDMNNEQAHQYQSFHPPNRPMSDAEVRMMNDYYHKQRHLS
ncbi:hypothetical protein Unana1_03942 [Umbelopsis nana]